MLYIGIPTYNGQIHHTTVSGLVQTAMFCGQHKVGFAVDVVPHDAFICRARNIIARRFMESGFTDLLFVDADVGFTAEDVYRVSSVDADIVMGLYPMKEEKLKFPASLTDPLVRHQKYPDLIKINYGPAGLMRVRLRVFEKMAEQWPEEWYSDANGKLFDFFPAGREGNTFTGEDISFCNRASQCGFDIWAVQGMTLKHTGEWTWEATWQIDVPQPKEAA